MSEEISGDDLRRTSADEGDGPSGAERLRRREFDAYERSLHRRRRLAGIGVPLVLLLGAAATIWALTRNREKASMTERESNDTPAQATLLPLDRPVEGHVGKRLAEGAPDLDYFRIPLAKGTRAVSARLEGIPGLDLVLELFDGQGRAVAKSDARGKSGGEWLQPTQIGPGEAFILVRQLWTQGGPLAEDVADAYRLSVHFGSPQAGWEGEPNDTPGEATPFNAPSRRLRGFLASADDRDWYGLASLSDGSYVAEVNAPIGVDVVLLSAETAHGEPADEKLTNKAGVGEKERLTFEIRAGKEFFLGVGRKREPVKGPKEAKGARDSKDAAALPDPKDQALAGLDDPYELTIEEAAPENKD